MAGSALTDEHALRIGRAIEALRRRVGVSQTEAGEAHDPPMSKQYWARHESGRVAGVFKPGVQQKLVDALSRAAGQEPALTLEDIEDVPGGGQRPAPAESRMARIAREAGGFAEAQASFAPAGGERKLILPTPDGDVVLVLPATMTPKGYKQLDALWAVFIKGEVDGDA